MYLYYDPEILLLDIYPREIFSYSSLKIVVFKSICIAYLVLVGIRISQYLHFVKFFYILLLFSPSTSAVTDSLSPHRLWSLLVHGLFSCCSKQGLLFVVVPRLFSLWWLLLLWNTGSRAFGLL